MLLSACARKKARNGDSTLNWRLPSQALLDSFMKLFQRIVFRSSTEPKFSLSEPHAHRWTSAQRLWLHWALRAHLIRRSPRWWIPTARSKMKRNRRSGNSESHQLHGRPQQSVSRRWPTSWQFPVRRIRCLQTSCLRWMWSSLQNLVVQRSELDLHALHTRGFILTFFCPIPRVESNHLIISSTVSESLLIVQLVMFPQMFYCLFQKPCDPCLGTL